MYLPSTRFKITVCFYGTLVLCLSLIDTAGYKVVLVLVLVFLLIMHHHSVSHVPNFCAKAQSLCPAFFWLDLFFFFNLPTCGGSFDSI